MHRFQGGGASARESGFSANPFVGTCKGERINFSASSRSKRHLEYISEISRSIYLSGEKASGTLQFGTVTLVSFIGSMIADHGPSSVVILVQIHALRGRARLATPFLLQLSFLRSRSIKQVDSTKYIG